MCKGAKACGRPVYHACAIPACACGSCVYLIAILPCGVVLCGGGTESRSAARGAIRPCSCGKYHPLDTRREKGRRNATVFSRSPFLLHFVNTSTCFAPDGEKGRFVSFVLSGEKRQKK